MLAIGRRYNAMAGVRDLQVRTKIVDAHRNGFVIAKPGELPFAVSEGVPPPTSTGPDLVAPCTLCKEPGARPPHEMEERIHRPVHKGLPVR